MKKLLLLTFVLFGILSVQSFAGGCIAQVCTCPNGGYVSYGEYCSVVNNPPASVRDAPAIPEYWFMLDIKNNSYQLIDAKTTDFMTAYYNTRSYEDKERYPISFSITARSYVAIATSEDNRLFMGPADTFYKGTRKIAEKRAIEDCKAGKEASGVSGAKGKKCRIIWMVSPNFKLENVETKKTYDLKVTSSL